MLWSKEIYRRENVYDLYFQREKDPSWWEDIAVSWTGPHNTFTESNKNLQSSVSIDSVCWYTRFLWMNNFWMNHSDSAGDSTGFWCSGFSSSPEVFSVLTDWPFVPPRSPKPVFSRFFLLCAAVHYIFLKDPVSMLSGGWCREMAIFCAMMSVRLKKSPKTSVLFCRVYVDDYSMAWLVRNCELLCLSGYFAVLRKCLNVKMSSILTVLTSL